MYIYIILTTMTRILISIALLIFVQYSAFVVFFASMLFQFELLLPLSHLVFVLSFLNGKEVLHRSILFSNQRKTGQASIVDKTKVITVSQTLSAVIQICYDVYSSQNINLSWNTDRFLGRDLRFWWVFFLIRHVCDGFAWIGCWSDKSCWCSDVLTRSDVSCCW